MPPPPTRSAIVTGASGGIGAAIARRLANDGCAVAVNFIDNAVGASDTVRGIIDAGGQAIAVQANIGDAAAVTELFDETAAAFGEADIIVNNASWRAANKVALADVTDSDFERTFTTNAKGCFLMCRAAARRMAAGGRMVNLSTNSILRAPPGYAPYAAAKRMVETFTVILSKELAGRDITVNAVAPGPTDTPFYFEGKQVADVAAIIARTPLGRLGRPQDAADIISFLVSPAGGWINGQVIGANGGLS